MEARTFIITAGALAALALPSVAGATNARAISFNVAKQTGMVSYRETSSKNESAEGYFFHKEHSKARSGLVRADDRGLIQFCQEHPCYRYG
jgi:hypothetical protein